MKYLPFPTQPGVIAGSENNSELFIRSVIFEAGYKEEAFHNHPNTFEFYIVLSGNIVFENDKNEHVAATANAMVYFETAEPHRIINVSETVQMLLIKKIGAEKTI